MIPNKMSYHIIYLTVTACCLATRFCCGLYLLPSTLQVQKYADIKLFMSSDSSSILPRSVLNRSLEFSRQVRRIAIPVASLVTTYGALNKFLVRPVLAIDGEDAFINSLAVILEAKVVIIPAKGAVISQAYDKARTNVQYILDFLKLEKTVQTLLRNSIDFCDDSDAIDAAGEAASRVANTALQFDGSIYTCIFIPTEDGTIPPSAEKYRKEAVAYYNSFITDLDTLLKVANKNQLAEAQKIATIALDKMPKGLFKSYEK